jgi:HD-GYP domain-containing protein (c-di-GMP phosphodiesterase class II)
VAERRREDEDFEAMLSTMTAILQPPTGAQAPAPAAGPVGPHVLETLAARFRPAGLMLVVFRAGGTVTFADPEAAEFFRRFAAPAMRLPHLSAAALATPGAWPSVPGLTIAGFAHAEKRQAADTIALIAKNEDFGLTEDVLRICGRLGLDAQWVRGLADQIPGYRQAALERQSCLLAETLADQLRVAGLEHERDSLSQQLADTYEELSLIYQLSGGMKVNRRAGDFFKQACLDVMQVMDVRGMGVALTVEVQDCPEPAVYGRVALAADDVRRLTADLMGILRQRKAPLVVDRLSLDPTFAWLGVHARQLLAVPLMRQDQVLGCLFALDKEDGDFDSVDSKLLNSIANESAIYLENATLYDDVHGLMMGLLHSLTSAVDAKDAYTCGHSERVALLSRNLAQQINLPDADVEQIYMAGLLHDVGKIGVPESVLQKPGRLTPEEFEHMKKHPEIGARIMADVKQLKPILPGVLHHHERYDGKGYPHGLAGERIPLMGRIICLADCFDAMTSSRTYRKALPVEVALNEIRRCSGTQFDPSLAEAFLRSTPDGLRELLRDHKERSKQLIEMQENLRSK